MGEIKQANGRTWEFEALILFQRCKKKNNKYKLLSISVPPANVTTPLNPENWKFLRSSNCFIFGLSETGNN